MSDVKYVHDENIHNTKDAEHIVPLIIELFHPSSVIDVGCGLGTFLKVFIDREITDVTGVEGAWLDQSKLVIDNDKVMIQDLEKDFNTGRRYDVALCLEVAEHLDESAAETLVKTLTSHSDIVIFSAAIPYQGGQNHINEQWIEYWEEIFLKFSFKMHDVLRPIIWNTNEIFWWYRQNIFACVRSTEAIKFSDGPVNNYVHPELYLAKVNLLNAYKDWIDKIFSGNIEVELAQAILDNAIKMNVRRET